VTGFPCTVRMLLMAWLIQLSCVTPSALAGENGPFRCAPAQGTSEVELLKLLDDTRTGDGFYRQLVGWKGSPSACKGSVGKGPSEGESRLELSWPDGSTFGQSFMLPEIFVVRYSSPKGLARTDEIIATFREYAGGRGLRVDWASPYTENKGDTRVIEYRDPDPGVNGIVRFTYDQQDRLVAVSLSLAP
jgi:YD repeat-containing protein